MARILADILSDLKIREKEFAETFGQKLLDEGTKKFEGLLASVNPGVLFIDEVYQLEPSSNQIGRAITNTLMTALEDDRDKLTVIVAGYKDDVRDKWMASNAGIISRFPFEISFEDFSEDELRTIVLGTVRSRNWHIQNTEYPADPPIAVDVARVAARRLARGRGKKGFANARSVRLMIEQAMNRASVRQKRERLEAVNHFHLPHNFDITLTIEDILGSPVDPSSSPLVAELVAMEGLDDVKKSVLGLIHMAKDNYISELRGEGVIETSLHRMFLGNPGTGKTTIASLYGRILAELGYLSKGEVIVVGASKLTGEAVGTTAAKVNALLDSAKGKVLVIDEAYVLARSNSLYGKEALDTLVERVQGTPDEDFAVILCGYESEMMAMLRDGNPGMQLHLCPPRFT